MEQFFLNFVNSIYSHLQWPGVVLLMTLESACIPIPSEIIMPLAGWLLVKNLGLPETNVFMAGAYGTLGCLLGSVISYYVGMAGGRPLLDRYGKYLLISHHDLDTADRFFKKYGSLSAFVSRLLPVVRTFISLPAGIARTNLPRFLIFTILGSFIWCVILSFIGYQLGSYWDEIRNVTRPFDYLLAGIIALLVAYYIYRHVRHLRRKDKTG